MPEVMDQDLEMTPELEEVLSGVCYCLAVRKASRRMIRLYDAELESHGLTIIQFALLAWIAGLGAPTVQILADRAAMDQSAMSRGLGPLERDGLVQSGQDETDKRKRVVRLTEDGRRRLTAAAPAWKRVQDKVAADQPGMDMATLMAAVKSMARG